ncbi:ABC transporter substrate-binding protein [Aromatoleum petrolei]|uniref:ABC transporter substrate-binding protein n=1 Tax=Aromatoleum petrolei TaxID=76116 RepID=A0ABX1MNB1_9RHOO|nr:ABC transporter substrate binding protein [Aromatoleum petrolei]NMF89268.1 hypothetical protein [Aromatoleum petrolei]QTQ35021.1 Putative ABC transporter, periplasmic binding protein [Aromatoleum petrolei]
MLKRLALLALPLLALALAVPSAFALEAAIVLSKRSDAQTAFAAALGREIMASAAVRLNDAGSTGDSINEAILKRADVVIAVGADAAEAIAERSTSPILVALISAPNLRALQQRHPRAKLAGFILDQPLGRHMRLIRATNPKTPRVGVLLGPQSAAMRSAIAEAGARQGLTMIFETIADTDGLLPALERLLESSDAILAVPDSTAYSPATARPILLTTYRYRKPLFGYSQAYVTAGAIASVFTAPEDAARQVGEWLAAQQGAGHIDLPAAEAPKYFSVSVNRHVARSLLYPVPDEAALVEAIDKRRPQ